MSSETVAEVLDRPLPSPDVLNRRGQTLEEALWGRVEKTPTCWLWTGCRDQGYGIFTFNRRNYRVHRLSWSLHRGLPEHSRVIDHLCRVRNCVNPDHLEVVEASENVLRGIGVTAINARKTHCVNGHPFDEENTYLDSNGYRHCRTCRNTAATAYKARKRNITNPYDTKEEA